MLVIGIVILLALAGIVAALVSMIRKARRKK